MLVRDDVEAQVPTDLGRHLAPHSTHFQRYMKHTETIAFALAIGLATAKFVTATRGQTVLPNVLDWVIGVPLEILYVAVSLLFIHIFMSRARVAACSCLLAVINLSLQGIVAGGKIDLLLTSVE